MMQTASVSNVRRNLRPNLTRRTLPGDTDTTDAITPEVVTFSDDDFEELALDETTTIPVILPPDEKGLVLDPLQQYLSRLRHIEPLPPEEQQGLAIKFQEAGDVVAAQKLVVTNLRLVVKIAREYQRRWADLLDLIQEGNVGLAEAVRRYDPYRGVRFTSYAQYWIRAMILNYLMTHFQPVKIGSTRAGRKLFYNLKKAREQLRRQGKEVTPRLIADMLDVDEAEVVRVAGYLDAPPVSIDAQAPGYEKTTYGELLPATTESPEEAAGEREVGMQIARTIQDYGKTLVKEREIAIWSERMIAEDPVSLVKLGDRFGVSKERVRQVEAQIRTRFKHFLIERHGADIQFEFLNND
jgi:RNA polymerase sigma-32 factor